MHSKANCMPREMTYFLKTSWIYPTHSWYQKRKEDVSPYTRLFTQYCLAWRTYTAYCVHTVYAEKKQLFIPNLTKMQYMKYEYSSIARTGALCTQCQVQSGVKFILCPLILNLGIDKSSVLTLNTKWWIIVGLPRCLYDWYVTIAFRVVALYQSILVPALYIVVQEFQFSV